MFVKKEHLEFENMQFSKEVYLLVKCGLNGGLVAYWLHDSYSTRFTIYTCSNQLLKYAQQQRWSPREHILKSLASNFTDPRKCPVLGSKKALFLDWLKENNQT